MASRHKATPPEAAAKGCADDAALCDANRAGVRLVCRAVGPDERGMRLDKFLAQHLEPEGLSREKIKKLILDGSAGVEGQASQPKTPLAEGDIVYARLEQAATSLVPEEAELVVLYKDADLAVINKPAGLTVHPAPGLASGTLAHRLVARFPELAAQEGFRPGIVHRLDKDTSGLMLVALNERTRLALAAMFAAHAVYKEYLALVQGVPARAEEYIEEPVGRHPTRKTLMAVTPGGKAAKSFRRTLVQGRGYSLQSVRIFSGRTHQVRVHMQHVGHPLFGDAHYGLPGKNQKSGSTKASARSLERKGRVAVQPPYSGPPPAGRQMLHAWKLAFDHPFPDHIRPDLLADAHAEGGRLSFCCPPPEDFAQAVRTLARAPLRAVVTGSPGCGKSTLAALLGERGVRVFSADAEIARQYLPGGDGHHLLLARYGARFVPEDNAPVDKAALGAAMRDDPALRREVEAMLHPLVWHALQEFWQESSEPAVAEIPLYLEAGRAQGEAGGVDMPVLVGVYASYPLRAERLRTRRGWSDALIAMMESWQWPEEKKMAACDIVVDNRGGADALSTRADELLMQLERLAEGRVDAVAEGFAAAWSCAGQ